MKPINSPYPRHKPKPHETPVALVVFDQFCTTIFHLAIPTMAILTMMVMVATRPANDRIPDFVPAAFFFYVGLSVVLLLLAFARKGERLRRVQFGIIVLAGAALLTPFTNPTLDFRPDDFRTIANAVICAVLTWRSLAYVQRETRDLPSLDDL